MSTLLKQIQKQTPTELASRSAAALDWYRNAVRGLNLTQKRILSDVGTRESNIIEGCMYLFVYDPKYKETLPYYDRFPLVVAVDRFARGFTGINLHYIAPRDRVKLLDALYDNLYNEEITANTRIKITYELLSSVSKMRFAKPCFKKYLAGHIKGTIRRVSAEDWDVVSMLPFQNFTINANTVYAESRKKY